MSRYTRTLILIAFVCSLFFSTLFASVPSALAQGGEIVIVDTGAANIRSGPAPNTTVLGSVRGGTELVVTGRNVEGTWWRVTSSYGVGWISDELVVFRGSLDAVPIVNQPVGTLETPTVIVDGYPATIYRNPDPDSFVIGIAQTGVILVVTGLTNDGNWWQVETSLGTGFINVADVAFRGDVSIVPWVADPGPDFDGPTIRANTDTSIVTQPGSGDVIATLVAGTALPASGRSDDNTWWQVAGDFGVGWIPVSHVSLSGAAGNIRLKSGATMDGPAYTGEGFATVVIEVDRKVAYYEDTFASPPMWDAHLGEQGIVLARSLDGLWLEVIFGKYTGWLNFSGITLQGEMAGIPTLDTTPPPIDNIVVVNTHWLNIRGGPGVQYAPVGYAPGGDILDVTGRHPTLPWIRVEGADFGVGWVRIMYIAFRGDWSAVPLVTEPVGPLEMPAAYIEINHHVYSYPDWAYPAGALPPELYTILGWTSGYKWALIESPLGNVWIHSDEFLLRGIAENAPIIDPGPEPAEVTPPAAGGGVGN